MNRSDVHLALADHPPEALRAILLAAKVGDGGHESAEALADRVARKLWWSFCTPLGYAMDRTTLEQIVEHVAKRLNVAHRVDSRADVWGQLEGLTSALVPEVPDTPGITMDDVGPAARRHLRPSWKRALALGGGAGSAWGARTASGVVLGFLDGPLGRILPLLPPVAPWVRTVYGGASAVRVVSGPLGVALAVLSANQALGTRYERLLPLLLGVGALGGRTVEEGIEVIDAD